MTTIYEIEQQAFLGPKQEILNILIIIYTFSMLFLILLPCETGKRPRHASPDEFDFRYRKTKKYDYGFTRL